MSSPLKQRCIVLFAAALLGVPTSAMAEGLGDLRVKSHLGEVFRAEIAILGMRPSFSEACIVQDPSLNDPETGLPRLRDAFITLDATGHRLLITSRQRISEPALHISLTVSCGSHVTRNYVALLSPREMAPAGASDDAPAKAIPAPKIAPAKRSVAERPRHRATAASTPAAIPAPPVAPAAVPALPPAASSTPLPAPAPTAAPPAGERLELSSASSELEQIEKEIAALNSELKRLSTGSETQSAETQTRILEMETRLVRMELRAARARMQSAMPVAGGAATAPLPAPAPAPAEPAAAAAPSLAAAAPSPAAGASAPDVAKTPRRVDSDGEGSGGLWTGLALLAALVAALVAYLLRRGGRHDDAGETSAVPAVASRVGARANRTGDTAAPASPAVGVPDIVVGPETLPPATPAEFSSTLADAADLPPDAEVVKLAEVMSAFGRIDGAIDALRAFVRDNPGNAVRPNLFLLKIYKEQGNRDAYEELAAKLRGDARYGGLAWDDPVDEIQRLLSAAG